MFRLPRPVSTESPLADYTAGFGRRTASLRQGRCRVVFLYEEIDYGSFRYRCYAMAQVLNARAPGIATWIFQDEIAVLEQSFRGVETLVCARSPWTNALERLLARAHSVGVRVIYDVDDLVFDSAWSPLVCNILHTRNRIEVDYWFAYVARRFAVANRCRFFAATNESLAGHLRGSFPAGEVSVVPNFPTREQLVVSEEIRSRKMTTVPDDAFLVGYFSGSATHNDDFALVEGELLDWMKRRPAVTLRVVGHLDLSGRFRDFLAEGRVEVLPLTDFLTLQWLIAECDVNIAPLVPGTFADCKSELKFFDAALVDTPTIATPTFAFRAAIEDGGTGFLAGAGEWMEKLEALYGAGPEGRGEMAVRAREVVLDRYSHDRLEELILRTYLPGAGTQERGATDV